MLITDSEHLDLYGIKIEIPKLVRNKREMDGWKLSLQVRFQNGGTQSDVGVFGTNYHNGMMDNNCQTGG